ncbi:MAG TPA: hypothetical protein VE818_05705 [Nitrososphaeraceae archaeon]|nr:hypothetical protein [Nitrososphaeraceae archaeon]
MQYSIAQSSYVGGGNGEQTWISPTGARCSANEPTEKLSCDDMVAKGYTGGGQR